MINSVVADLDFDLWDKRQVTADDVISGDRVAIARAITGVEAGKLPQDALAALTQAAARHQVPVLGITGTGGSGKSSLTDELVRRLRIDQQDKLRVAVVAVDPTRRKGGGALLGDRIRMNSLDGDRVYFRSLATRGAHELPDYLGDVITVLKAAGFDLVVVETPGIGQGDAAVVPYVDTSLYVMTPEFGAASQLEKIDMLDFADVVAINKFERRGAEDAHARRRPPAGPQPRGVRQAARGHAGLRHQRRDVQRRRRHRALPAPRAGCSASSGLHLEDGALPRVDVRHSSKIRQVVPSDRVRYLSEITETVRGYHARTDELVDQARRVQRLDEVAAGARRGPSRAAYRRCSSRPREALDDGRRRSSSRSGPPSSRSTPSTPAASRCPATGSRGSRCRRTSTTASWCSTGAARTSRAASPSPPGSSRSSARTRTRPGCSPARATRPAPTAGSRCSPRGCRRPGSPRRSTR